MRTAGALWLALFTGCVTPYTLRAPERDPAAPVCLKDVQLNVQQRRVAAPSSPACVRDCVEPLRQAFSGFSECPAGSVAERFPLTLDIQAESTVTDNPWTLLPWLLTAFTFPVYLSMEGHYAARVMHGEELVATWQGTFEDWILVTGGFPVLGALSYRNNTACSEVQDTLLVRHVAADLERHLAQVQPLYAKLEARERPPPQQIATAEQPPPTVAQAPVPGKAELEAGQAAYNDGEFELALQRFDQAAARSIERAQLGRIHLYRAKCYRLLKETGKGDIVAIDKALNAALDADPEARLDPDRDPEDLVDLFNSIRKRRRPLR